MRLRLRVQRNELPTVNSLWPVTDSQQKNTIAQLLESINQTFPLEADKWGLEDYVVTVAGFECLHWHEISAVCKDEDEVVVRPLTYAEVRARTLMGRSQISGDGRKLEDGIAFGRPLLRAPVRPEVRIPPRKRKRDGEDQDEGDKRVRFTGNDEIEGVPLGGHKTIMAPGQGVDDEDDDDEEDDGNFELGEDATSSDDESESSDASSSSSDSDSSESTASSGSSESSSESSSDSSSEDSSDDSSEALSRNPKKYASKVKQAAQPKAVDAMRPPVINPSTTTKFPAGIPRSLPHEGQQRTRDRNARRRDSKKLAHLKKQGILPTSADLVTLREWERTGTLPKSSQPTTKQTDSADTDSVTLNGGGSKHSPDSEEEADLSVRRQNLLDSIASGGLEIGANGKVVRETEVDEGPEEQSNKLAADNAALADRLFKENIESMSAVEAEQASTALRRGLDVNSAQRLLYGSLGVRAPKNQEQREALQKRLAGRQGTAAPKRKNATQPKEDAPPEDEAEDDDPDAWLSKIDLRAVECCDEGVTLSTPPFPFYQRWDPQYRKKKNRNLATYADAPRKRRRGNQQDLHGTYAESYDKYNQDGTGDVLDYDGDGANNDDYWEEGALLDDEGDEDDLAEQQLLNEANVVTVVDDFPPLPQDLNTLATLTDEHARKGDYIIFTKLECSPVTGWQPKMLTRTVQLLEKEDDGGWKTKAALRDLPAKEYDEHGNRVYGKFEMAGLSDDEDEGYENERIEVLDLDELMDMRLLKRADEDAAAAAAEQESTA